MNLSYSFFYKEKKINIRKVYVSIIIWWNFQNLLEKMTMIIIKITKLLFLMI